MQKRHWSAACNENATFCIAVKTSQLDEASKPLTDSRVVEHRRQDQQDVVGPVLPVEGHLKLLDHQDVQMTGALHRVVNVEQAVLLAPRGRGEDRTLQQVGVLGGGHGRKSFRLETKKKKPGTKYRRFNVLIWEASNHLQKHTARMQKLPRVHSQLTLLETRGRRMLSKWLPC